MSAAIARDHYRKTLLETPFHPHTAASNQANEWHRWNGYTVPTVYDDVEAEYFAIRNACTLFDLSPMSKYRISGRDAEAFLNRLLTRDVTKLTIGQVAYVVWCNDDGKVVDDGTLFRLEPYAYRLCAQERNLDWLLLSSTGFDVHIKEETHEIAALSVQGPTSYAALVAAGLDGLEVLKPYRVARFAFNGRPLTVSRTGFTGDLGYELWMDPDDAYAVWEDLSQVGPDHGLKPIATEALDIARVEAGFIQAGRDFMPACETVRAHHTRSPYELGLDWLVDLSKANFTGKKALAREAETGPKEKLVKLDIAGNKPAKNAFIFSDGHARNNVGVTTSAIWSPSCKASIALAFVKTDHLKRAASLWAEIYDQRELGWTRTLARCQVVEKPFWNPKRRRATPPGQL